jgi:hypothetical protein
MSRPGSAHPGGAAPARSIYTRPRLVLRVGGAAMAEVRRFLSSAHRSPQAAVFVYARAGGEPLVRFSRGGRE